jgi:DNA-binding response OmpR family regulator
MTPPSTRTDLLTSVTGTDWDQDHACVLVVDDDSACGVFHARMLTDAGIPALVVHDGPTALDYARHHDVELMLLDRRLPSKNGIEVLERLGGDARTQRIPVIILISENETSAVAQGLDAGANDSLAMPVKAVELVAHVRAIVRDRPSPPRSAHSPRPSSPGPNASCTTKRS